MYEYLYDTDFLYKIDNMKLKTLYIKLILLDFTTEKAIQEVLGIALSGAITVNSTAAIRRTLNLVLWADESSNDIENAKNLISINSKIKIFTGLKNPFKRYAHYGDIIWFPQGVFVVNSALFTRSNTGCNISIQGRDKMVLLDGSVGGTIPASTTFSEKFIYDKEGNITVEYPTLVLIIRESVNHLGGLDIDKIIISDLDETAKLLVRYIGDTPLWFSHDYSGLYIADEPPSGFKEPRKFTYGEDVGYKEVPFTYPGELTLNAGSSVKAVLDKICNVLGNFEFFFDLDGNFIFREIKNYQRVSYTPIVNIGEETYIKDFSDDRFQYALTDANTVVSYLNSPRYADVKNDFVVWGKRTTQSGVEVDIRYHLAVDVKPNVNDPDALVNKYMWEITEGDEIIRYDYTIDNIAPAVGAKLISTPSTEWREELYRRACNNSIFGTTEVAYDAELLAEWRNLYDPMNEDWKTAWEKGFTSPFTGWNPAVFTAPQTINYWLDFIDSTDAIAQYSVNVIGRRTKAVNDNEVKSIYNMEVPDIIFVENPEDPGKIAEIANKFNLIGLPFCMITSSLQDYFQASSTPKSGYDAVRELLYKHLTYNSTVTINCQPKYYLEPNTLIYIEDKKSGIVGNYIITQFSIPFNYSGTMNLVAVLSLTRV